MTERRVDPTELESLRKESLEKEIIAILARLKEIDIRIAIDIYYRSKLSAQIDRGIYGIQYLDAHYLANDLIENEPELFLFYNTLALRDIQQSLSGVAENLDDPAEEI